MTKRMLVLSTVAQSLALQSPIAWQIARDRGFDVTFAAAHDAWADSLEGEFLELSNAREVSPNALLHLAADLRSLLRSQPWDAVVVQTPIVAALARLLMPRPLRRKTLYIAHGLHFYRERSPASVLFRAVEGGLARLSHVAVVNRWDCSWFESLPGVLKPISLTRLPGAGVDTARFARASPHRNAPRRYAMFVGELNTNKDPLFVVDVIYEARKSLTDLELVMIGSGPLARDVNAYVSDKPWVTVIKRSTEIPSWISGAVALLAPSHREGLPRVHLEALAAGVPVLSRPNKGSREVLRDLPELLLEPGSSPERWAQRLIELVDSDRASAYLRAASEYDIRSFSSDFEKLIIATWERKPE